MTAIIFIISLVIYVTGILVTMVTVRSILHPVIRLLYSSALYITVVEIFLLIIHFVTYNQWPLKGLVASTLYFQLFLTPLALTLLILSDMHIAISLKFSGIAVVLACFNVIYISNVELFSFSSREYCLFVDGMVLMQILIQSLLRSISKYKFIAIGILAQILLIITGDMGDCSDTLPNSTLGLIWLSLLPTIMLFWLRGKIIEK